MIETNRAQDDAINDLAREFGGLFVMAREDDGAVRVRVAGSEPEPDRRRRIDVDGNITQGWET